MKTFHSHHEQPFDPVRHFPVNHAPKPLFSAETNVHVARSLSHGEVVIRVRAVAMDGRGSTRQNNHTADGNPSRIHLSGTIEANPTEVHKDSSSHRQFIRAGTEVYGMASSGHESILDEFIVTNTSGLAPKPKNLTWVESAAVAQSGLTAWQALFVKAGIPEPNIDALAASGTSSIQQQQRRKLLLVTDASGDVGIYLIQLAALVGLHIVAVTKSKAQDEAFLMMLGVSEVLGYDDLRDEARFFDYIINSNSEDSALSQCWMLVANNGTFISVDPDTSDFAENRPTGKEHVKAIHSVAEPSPGHLSRLSRVLELEFVKPFIAETVSSDGVTATSERLGQRGNRRGSVVSTIAR